MIGITIIKIVAGTIKIRTDTQIRTSIIICRYLRLIIPFDAIYISQIFHARNADSLFRITL